METLKGYLFFSSADKVVAIKIMKKWKDCKVIIYHLKTEIVESLSDKGYGSYERHFMAFMNIGSVFGSVQISNRESYEKHDFSPEYEIWGKMEVSFAKQYHSLVDKIKEEECSNTDNPSKE